MLCLFYFSFPSFPITNNLIKDCIIFFYQNIIYWVGQKVHSGLSVSYEHFDHPSSWNHIECILSRLAASLVAQRVKHLPALRETQVQFLSREDPLEKEMATHSSILTRKIPWMEESGRPHSMGSQRVRHDWVTSLTSLPWLSSMHVRFPLCLFIAWELISF